MKVEVSDLEDMAEEGAKEAVEEGAQTQAGKTTQSAMQEYVEFKRAEQELESAMSEQASTGSELAEAFKEVMTDPQARTFMQQMLFGDGAQLQQQAQTGPGGREIKHAEPPAEPDTNMDTQEPETDGGIAEETADISEVSDTFEVSVLELYHLMLSTLNNDEIPDTLTVATLRSMLESNEDETKARMREWLEGRDG